MKRFLSLLLALCLVLALTACATGGEEETTAGPIGAGKLDGFCVGFGRADITPKDDGIPMASYGNPEQRLSQGLFTYLHVNVLAVSYDEDILLLLTIDHSWFNKVLANPVKERIKSTYGIPDDHILMQGTHTHGAPNAASTSITAMAQSNTRTIDQTMKAVEMALNDRKPAEIYVGSAQTENMNFVRRYFMDDGSFTTDNYAGTGTRVVEHESEADGEMQLMKFVREGGKDILIANFQAHPHLEGKNPYLSWQNVGAFRENIEKLRDVYSIYWQGAAGNLNSHSRIDGETVYQTRDEYGAALATYANKEYDNLKKVESGPVKVASYNFVAEVNHSEDHLIDEASKINKVWSTTNDSAKAMAAAPGTTIASVYHASGIVSRFDMPATMEIQLMAFSFGDVSGVYVPYEMFDTNGMQIKAGTPFEKTFIFGYAGTSAGGYIPSAEAWANSGYEVNTTRYAQGTAEKLVDTYLDMLKELHG